MPVVLILLSATLCVSQGQTNLLNNPDLEVAQFGSGDGGWYASGCTATLADDSFTGSHSVKVTNRKANWAGMNQVLHLKSGTNYYFKAHMKALNVPSGDMTANVQVMVYIESSAGHQYLTLSVDKEMQPNIWQAIGGDFKTPSGLTSARLYLQPTDPTVNYLLDSSSLVEIPPLPADWRTTANATIEKIRKADINIQVEGHPSTGDLHDVTVEVVQTKHEFGFGTALKASDMTDNQKKKFQDMFYDNFEWATIANKLKWRLIEWTEGHIDYHTALDAINAMLLHGTKIRAHNLFWDRSSNVPAWLRNMTGQDLIRQMERRINGIVTKTKGKVQHWDVNNEAIHGDFFEAGTGDVNITMWMFDETHKVDPNVKLFLNDYGVIKDRYSTQAYYNQAMMFKARPDVPLYGLGIQAHMHPDVDVSVVKYRLDQILPTGYPLWITEFDLPIKDENERADRLEDLLTLFFSTQQVEGLIFWGVWWTEDHPKALFNGDDVTPNAAGRRYQQLFKRDWRTNESVSLASGHAHARGFKGEYSLRVVKHGHTLKTETFSLTGSGVNLKVALTGADNRLDEALLNARKQYTSLIENLTRVSSDIKCLNTSAGKKVSNSEVY